MKKLFVLVVFLLFIIVGCSNDVTENPTSPQANSSVKSQALPKEGSDVRLTHEKVFPEVLKFMEKKRKEYGIKVDPNLKPYKSERIDITQIPGIVIPTLSEIEKLSTGNGKYFSGHNYRQIENSSPVMGKSSSGQSIVQNDGITLDYYSWCVPYPSPQKPFFEYMGSAQTSSIEMDYMFVESDHFLNLGFQDYVWAEDDFVSSLDVSDWHSQAPEPYFWEVGGWHYFERLSNLPWIQFLGQSYANDGSY
ncbi:MAG: hypothetical protein HY963_01805 [Ignavibacteriales bacterium]|nr:hypothetical protein [Ignavibacteriales bacterium]